MSSQQPPTMPHGNAPAAYSGSSSESDALGALVSLRGAPKTDATEAEAEMTPQPQGPGIGPGPHAQARMMSTVGGSHPNPRLGGGMDPAADARYAAYHRAHHGAGMAGAMPGMHPMPIAGASSAGGMNMNPRAHEMAMMNQMMTARAAAYSDEARMMAAGFPPNMRQQHHHQHQPQHQHQSPNMGAMRGSSGGAPGYGPPHLPMGASRPVGMMGGGGYAPPVGAPPPLSARGGQPYNYSMDMSAGGIARANMMAAASSQQQSIPTATPLHHQQQQQSASSSQSTLQVHSPKNNRSETTNNNSESEDTMKDGAKQAHPENYVFPNPPNKKAKFPYKLYDMLMYSSASEYKMGVSWTPDGHGFVIRDRDALTEILPQFFSQTKYRSFTRQLNLWGFHRYTEDGWQHDHFVRGDIEDLKHVEYTKVKGGSKSDGPVKSKLIRKRMQQHYKEARNKGVVVNKVEPHEGGVVKTVIGEEEARSSLPPVVNKGGGLVAM